MSVTIEQIKEIVKGKMIDKTIDLSYEELSEKVFGEGNCYSDCETRKRMYGVKYILDLLEKESMDNVVANRILAVSDTHVPFNLPVSTFERFVGKVDTLVLGGDLVDCQSISKFPKTYRVSMMEEIIQGRQYIIDLIEYIKPKRVEVIYGNHDIRFQAYLAKSLDTDLLELMPQTPLELIFNDGFNHYNKRNKTKTWYEPISKMFDGIEVVYHDNWWCKVGKTIFCHPSAFSSGIMKTAEKAMIHFNTQDRDYQAICMAHTHQLGEYLRGDIILYEQGTCSDTKKMNYTDGKLYNPQQQGCLYMCQDADGKVMRDKTKLVKL